MAQLGQYFARLDLGTNTPPQTAQRFSSLISENLCFQRSDLRQDRPAEPLAADRERNGLRAGVGIPIVKNDAVPVRIVAALPADKGVCLFSLCRCHAVNGTVMLALYGRQSFDGMDADPSFLVVFNRL